MTERCATAYKMRERYQFGWTDYRAVYGKKAFKWPRITMAQFVDFLGMLIGVGMIVAPVAVVGWWLFWG